MAPEETSEATTNHPRRSSSTFFLAVFLAAAVGLLGFYLWSLSRAAAAEKSAAAALRELGALVVMDGSGQHVASVNLSVLQSPEALAKAIDQLHALTHLTSLDASRTGIGDQHLETIGKMSSLNSLSLIETKIGDEGAQRLGNLKNLETLYLASTGITGASLDVLSGLNRLRVLDLSATKIAGNLRPLAGLPQLEWLILRNLTLDDDALDPLATCQSLRRLTLENSKFSEQSAGAVKQALPSLLINK